MGETEHLGAGVDSESELWEKFHEYRDPGESKSATIRQLLRAGLEKKGYMETPETDQPEPTGFAVSAYNLATAAFQISVIGVFASVFAAFAAQSLYAPVALFTAAAALTSILATLTAAVAARVDSSALDLRSRILGVEADSDDENADAAPTAEPSAGGD